MSDFLKQKKTINNCTSCRVQPSNISIKVNRSLHHKEGKGDVLILVDMVEYKPNFDYLVKFLTEKGFDSFQIHSVCLCRTESFELPTPVYEIYNHCSCIDLDKLKYKVILCLGRSLSYLIQGDDFQYWGDFSEFLFNPTYFIHKEKRVYPIPFFSEWKKRDTIQSRFVIKQLIFLKEHLNSYGEYKVEPYKIIKVGDVNEFLNKYSSYEGLMAWDTETSSLDVFSDDFKVGCITLTFDGEVAYYLPIDDTVSIRLLNKFFKNKYQITANGKYDVKALYNYGVVNCRVDEDIIILSHLLNTVRAKNGLKTLAWYVGLGGYDKELGTIFKTYKCKTYLDIPESILINYAGLDAIVTYRVFEWLKNDLVPKQQCIYDTYKKYVIPVIPIFAQAEIRGMNIDIEYLNNLNIDISKEIDVLDKNIQLTLNTKFDVNSNEQLGKVLEYNNFPVVERTKKGVYRTGESQLKYWEREGYVIAKEILEYRALQKLKSSFVGEHSDTLCDNLNFFDLTKDVKEEGIAKHIRQGVIHPTFNPARTDSWRASSNNPNLQNIPKKGSSGKRMRPLFECPKGFYICEADYSGFQLRIAAILSKDEVMKDIFLNKGGDIHSITAQSIFCKDITLDSFLVHKNEEPYKTYRNKAKAINFGFLFGRSEYSFKSDIEENWSVEEIDLHIENNNLIVVLDREGSPDKVLTVSTDIRNKFFKTYPKLGSWIEESRQLARKNGYRDCILGGRRHLPSMLYTGVQDSLNKKEISHNENVAINSIVQTFEALIVYKAMIKLNEGIIKNNFESNIVGMVHDSIVIYMKKEEVSEMYFLIKEAMEDYTSFDIPLLAEVELGSVWGFGEEVTEKNLNNF